MYMQCLDTEFKSIEKLVFFFRSIFIIFYYNVNNRTRVHNFFILMFHIFSIITIIQQCTQSYDKTLTASINPEK